VSLTVAVSGGMTITEIQEDYRRTHEEMQTILAYAAFAAEDVHILSDTP